MHLTLERLEAPGSGNVWWSGGGVVGTCFLRWARRYGMRNSQKEDWEGDNDWSFKKLERVEEEGGGRERNGKNIS